jgi:hypothetical protein
MNMFRGFLLRGVKLLADDWRLAAFSIAWIGIVALLVALHLPGSVAGPSLFLGLAGLLAESVRRGARK